MMTKNLSSVDLWETRTGPEKIKPGPDPTTWTEKNLTRTGPNGYCDRAIDPGIQSIKIFNRLQPAKRFAADMHTF